MTKVPYNLQNSLQQFSKYLCFFAVIFLTRNGVTAQNNDLTYSSNTTFAQVANAAAINPTNITVEAWVYATAWRTNEYEGSIVNKEGGAGGYMLRCGNSGQLSFYVYSGGNWRGGSTATNALSLNTWTHVAGVFNGTNVLIFINGVQVASYAYTGTITASTERLEIGRSVLNTGRYFMGKIDEVRVWNTGLSAAVINSWYNKTITSCHPNYSNLVGYYECNNTTAGVLTATVGSNGTVSGATYGASTSPITSVTGFQQTTAAQPNTSNVAPGTNNAEIIRLEVETFSTMDATQFVLQTNGTTNVADISNAKLWYTGSSSTFSTTTQFGTTIVSPPAAGTDMTFNGTQTLVCGKNYFWLTYDVAAGATSGNVVDAVYQSAVVNSITRTPVISAPAGSRPILIVYCSSSAANSGDEDITNVTFGSTLNNTSACASLTGTQGVAAGSANLYSNFSSSVPATSITAGTTIPISVTITECGGTAYTHQVNVYIDFNNNGVLNDAGETFVIWPLASSNTHTITSNITVPASAVNGNVRMRIVCQEAAIGGPCTTASWGETEDYTVNIATAPMTYISSTTTQNNTSNTLTGSTNQEIIGIQVVTTGSSSPLSITQFTLNATGSTAITDINSANSAKIYYTGTSSTFSTTTLFGQATPTLANFNINGSQTLSTGTNYFWLSYDIQTGATVGNVVDAQCTSFMIGSSQSPATTSPSGNRTIVTTTYPGGVSTGLQTWLRADVGVSGTTPITGWDNQNASGTPVLVNGSPNLNNTNTSYNYNPYVEFAGIQSTYTPNSANANRQFLKLSGYNGISGIDYRSLFWTFHTTDLTREYQHIATVDDITHLAPSSTLHGASTSTQSAVHLDSYDVTDFGSSSAAGTWRRNNLNIVNDAIHSTSKHVLSAVSSSGGGTTINRFLGGQRDHVSTNYSSLGYDMSDRDWKGPVAEIIGYTTQLTATERQKIHSYLGIKYGLTLTQDYLNTSGGTIFSTAAPYNNNIIGIGRDDAEGLSQKQSHNDDDVVRIYMGTLAAMNFSNGSTFSSNISYVVTGANTGAMCATATAVGEMPVSCGLYSRIEREWKVTRTNMAQNFNMDFRLSACAVPGSVNVADLRLLVDDDGNFSNGGTTCYSNATDPGLFSYSNPTITVTGITSAMIPNNSTRFITIGSVNPATPLPVELLIFDAKLNNKRTVDLTWTTASEHNCDYFVAQKSIDLINWENVEVVNGAGNSSVELDYYCEDKQPFPGTNYYRLKQVDYDGSWNLSDIRVVDLTPTGDFLLYPNPAKDIVVIKGDKLKNSTIRIMNALGQVIVDTYAGDEDMIQINTEEMSNGMYTVIIIQNNEVNSQKLMIIK